MTTHFFTLTLAGYDVADDRIANGLYDAGCDDANVSSTGGTIYVAFYRDAESYEAAVASAVAAVEGAGLGLTVVKVEPDDFDDQPEGARASGGKPGESAEGTNGRPRTTPAAGR